MPGPSDESLDEQKAGRSQKKKKKPLTVLEAVDHISELAELDRGQECSLNQQKIKESFYTINTYLHHLYQKERAEILGFYHPLDAVFEYSQRGVIRCLIRQLVLQ